MTPCLPGSSVHGDLPGKNTRVGCHFLLQGIFLIQRLNPCLPHWQADSLPLNHQGNPLVQLESSKTKPYSWGTYMILIHNEKQASKHSNSQGPEHLHSKYLYLPLNQHNGSWMGSGSIFALITFLLSIHSCPLHLHPLPLLKNEPKLLSASSQATMSRETTGEWEGHLQQTRRQNRVPLTQTTEKTHSWKKAPQAKASLTAERWQWRWCMSPLNTETKKGS